jgi:sigma-B regulation protein RsbU (phosphoserine phosphatase)
MNTPPPDQKLGIKQKGLSLRYKILLVLILLPLSLLGIYLVVAINVFKSDKIAYVFESSTTVSRNLSSNAMTSLNSILASGRPCMQDYVLHQSFGEVSHGILANDGLVDWIAVYSEGPQGFVLESSLGKTGIDPQLDLARINPVANILPELVQSNRLVKSPTAHENKVLIGEKVLDNGKPKYFLMSAKAPDLVDLFRASNTGESYLIDESGRILMGPDGVDYSQITQRTGPDYINKLKKQSFASGAETFNDPAGEPMLASFAKTGFAGTTVVSLTPQKNALKAVSILIIRSILFVLVLISVSVIIGLFASNNLTASISELSRATLQIAEGNFRIRVRSKATDEVGLLATSFNAMAEEVSRLMSETAEKARMQNELNTAKTVQETLFPPTVSDMGYIKVAGFYEPASECGGDWWFYSEVDDKVLLWIGDATGHGAPAALITSAARSASTIIERLNLEPKDALTHMNRAIYDVSKGRIMMTFFLASIDRKTKKMTFANASHEAPYLIHKVDRDLKKKDLIPLNDVMSPRLGQDRETEYEQHTIDLEHGDRILFYTDGVPDIQNPGQESWGERQFVKTVTESVNGFPPVAMSIKVLVDRFTDYRKQAPLIDDVTFFMIQVEDNV